MSTITIPEETLKQWQEDCDLWIEGQDEYLTEEDIPLASVYIAAKTSSYEREYSLGKKLEDSLENERQYRLLSMEQKDGIQKLQEQLNISQGAYDDLWAKCSDEHYWMKENQKLQERIKELENDSQLKQCLSCGAISMNNAGIAMMSINKVEIAKRDDLIEQAKSYVETLPSHHYNSLRLRERREWLKQVDELKEGK